MFQRDYSLINNNDVENCKKIISRFGEVYINLGNKIFFPSGLIGFSLNQNFCLTYKSDIPKFNILQSIDNDSLSFLTLPLFLDNHIIAQDDLENTGEKLGIPLKNLAIILIASSKMIDQTKKITLNARAPIFIDTDKKTAFQYVLQNTQYSFSEIYQ